MKPIRILNLFVLAAFMAMAFGGTGSALAESTSLCAEDESTCVEGNQITHIHEETLFGAKAKLLSSVLNVECDVLFLGDSVGSFLVIGEEVVSFKPLGLAGSLLILGHFTYSNCNSGCTTTEENGPVEIKVSREGTELAKVTGEGLVHLVCSGFINCRYNGTGLLGHGLGPLTSSETNGSVTLSEQTTNKESGTFCPSTAKLDITTTPLEPTYISS